jgi:formylglycine-generating enzyme required for sulfatase activity
MNRTVFLLLFLLVMFTSLYLPFTGIADEVLQEQRNALLIGVDKYDNIDDLKYCGSDVQAVKSLLADSNFQKIVAMTTDSPFDDKLPNLKNIETQLAGMINETPVNSTILIMLSGHGFSQNGKSFYCPKDTNLKDLVNTALLIDTVMEQLSECKAKTKILIVDACRDIPNTARTVADKSTEFMNVFDEMPAGVFALISCSPEEQSREDSDFQHGVFTYFLLAGLKGEADDGVSKNGWVEFIELCNFIKHRTSKHVKNKFHDNQNPAFRVAGELRDFPLAEVKRQQQTLTNSIGIKFVKIPAGTFRMGTDEKPADIVTAFQKYYEADKLKKSFYESEYPSREVKFEKPFYIGQSEITRGQFERFVNETGYKTDAEKDGRGGSRIDAEGNMVSDKKASWRNPGFDQDETHPVVNVSWNDAVVYCDWLSKKEGKKYRLPTEAEWEYAAKAGTTTRYWFGDEPEDLAKYDNVADTTGKKEHHRWTKIGVNSNDGFIYTAPVDALRANPWGLFGIHGNVAEWCGDRYGTEENRYNVRGGSWYCGANLARSTKRQRAAAVQRKGDTGFRIVWETE